jgi:hypothetical protein
MRREARVRLRRCASFASAGATCAYASGGVSQSSAGSSRARSRVGGGGTGDREREREREREDEREASSDAAGLATARAARAGLGIRARRRGAGSGREGGSGAGDDAASEETVERKAFTQTTVADVGRATASSSPGAAHSNSPGSSGSFPRRPAAFTLWFSNRPNTSSSSSSTVGTFEHALILRELHPVLVVDGHLSDPNPVPVLVVEHSPHRLHLQARPAPRAHVLEQPQVVVVQHLALEIGEPDRLAGRERGGDERRERRDDEGETRRERHRATRKVAEDERRRGEDV